MSFGASVAGRRPSGSRKNETPASQTTHTAATAHHHDIIEQPAAAAAATVVMRPHSLIP
jgi:hypothetical protein